MGRVNWSGLLGSVALLLCLAPDASAQYFGRNKVQYDRERVLLLATEHFDIYYSQEDSAAAVLAGRMAERWHRRLSTVLDHTLSGRQPIVLYGSHRRFEQTNVYGGLVDESTGGFTDSRKRRIVLPFASSLADTDHVLGHEIVHAFQFDIADRHRSPLGLPLWFIEGMAEYLTLGADPQTAMWMRDAVHSGPLPSVQDLGKSRYFPYRWGAAMWSHLVERFGADLPARALRAKRGVNRRLQEITGESLDELSRSWHAALRRDHGGPAAAAAPAPLISNRRGAGRLNLAAALSPDGSRMVFLSERDQFSIDLYLADARTGRVIRRLLTTAANANFESLQYLHSAGAWAPDGSRYALATTARGRATLVVLDVDRPGATRELQLQDVDEIYSPSWSPDGNSIVLSAQRGGVTDLSILTLSTAAIRQVTRDAYADVQPAWSPDGRTIAFTTDRFTTNLTLLHYGPYRIGLLDVATGIVTPAPAVDGLNYLDPEWGSPQSLFVVADPGGLSNVFRLDLETARMYRVTNFATGVSGVTPTSPALSVAARTGALAFSVFRDNGFDLHQITTPEALAGTPFEPAVAPRVPTAGAVATTDDSIAPVPPLPMIAAGPRTQQRYRPRLSLEGIGSPYLSAGGGPVGGYMSGGGSLLFGDLLGDHQLLTALYLSSRLEESAAGVMYVNRKSRWNWGVTFDQTPDLRVRHTGSIVAPDREHVVTRTRERMLWTNRHLGGFSAYPLNRSQRLELSGGMRQISFARERLTEQVSTLSGMVVEADETPLGAAPAVGIADAGLALVGDTAVFGATGPMLGSRYRLQTTANVGGLTYASVVADYRRYVMPVRPYTLALRLVHSGRYGGDAGDFRLRDVYVGSPTLVRGYGPADVVRSDCPAGSADCPALNTLLANRVAAVKLELRAPLWSVLTGSSRVKYGILPIDAFVFADAGAGWGGEQRFGPAGSDGKFVRSAGAGLRLNVIGLVLDMTAVRPFDLQRRGWSFGVNLRPGF